MTAAVAVEAVDRAARPAALRTAPRRAAGLTVATTAALAGALASLAIGSLEIPLADVWAAFTAHDRALDAHVVVTEMRLPRTLVGLVVGAGLAVAGVLMQAVTRNPLAEPGVLGINAGAALAVVLAIALLDARGAATYAGFALAGGGVAMATAYALGATGRDGVTPIKLALAGAVIAAFCKSLTSGVLILDAKSLDEMRFWLVGSIAGRDVNVLAAVVPFAGAGLLLAALVTPRLNALALGDDVARSLGQRVGLVRATAFAASVLLAAAAVAAAGPVGFVGLIVPHAARALCGPDHRWMVPFSAAIGAALLLWADVVGRVVVRPAELEVGVVTALLGAPLFIALVRRRRLAEL